MRSGARRICRPASSEGKSIGPSKSIAAAGGPAAAMTNINPALD